MLMDAWNKVRRNPSRQCQGAVHNDLANSNSVNEFGKHGYYQVVFIGLQSSSRCWDIFFFAISTKQAQGNEKLHHLHCHRCHLPSHLIDGHRHDIINLKKELLAM